MRLWSYLQTSGNCKADGERNRSEGKLEHEGMVYQNFTRHAKEVIKIVETIFILIFQGNLEYF